MSKSVRESLNETLERLTGCAIGEKYIQTDKKGWLKYIPAGSLYRGMPLILSHYVGALFVVLPHEDYHDLIRGKIPVWEYVNEAVWSYGYFWGAGNLRSGIYWQVLEDGKPGIHDTMKIKRYLTIMQCHTAQHHLGMDYFDKARCLDCKEEHCPVSPMTHKKADATIEGEFPELAKAKRVEFYNAVAKMLKERFELKLCALHIDESLDKERKNIYLVTGFIKGSAKIVLSQALYMDMMYFPENYDVQQMLKKYDFLAATQVHNKKARKTSFKRLMKITETTTARELKKFWYEE